MPEEPPETPRTLESQIPPQVHQLAEYVATHIKTQTRDIRSTALSWYYPLEMDNPQEIIPFLYTTFRKLHTRFKAEGRGNISMLECGSGVGTIGNTAALAGYEVYNVDNDTAAVNMGLQFEKELRERAILPSDAVIHAAVGSYYIATEWTDILNRWKVDNLAKVPIDEKERKLFFYSLAATIGIRGENIEPDVNHEALIDGRLAEMGEQTTTLSSLGLLDQNQQLKADVVYTYPSDPFFPYGFIPQMGKIMKPGSCLLIATGSAQAKRLPSILSDFFSPDQTFLLSFPFRSMQSKIELVSYRRK